MQRAMIAENSRTTGIQIPRSLVAITTYATLQDAFGRTDPGNSIIEQGGLIKCLSEGLIYGLDNVVGILAVHEVDMDRGAALVGERLKEFLNEFHVKASGALSLKIDMKDQERPI